MPGRTSTPRSRAGARRRAIWALLALSLALIGWVVAGEPTLPDLAPPPLARIAAG